MTEAEADERVEAELDRVWPDWRGDPGTTSEVGLRLIRRHDEFDYNLVNVPVERLADVIIAIHRALGAHAGHQVN